MASKDVTVNFRTKADLKAAKAAEKALERVNKALEENDFEEASKEARKFNKELDEMADVSKEARTEIKNLVGNVGKTSDGMGRATKAQDDLSTAQKKGAKSTRNSGLAMLELSRGVEDAQYGLRGVQNNIAPLIQSLGGGAGLAGVIGLVSVAIGILGPKLLEMIDLMIDAKDAADFQAEATARMAKAEIDAERDLEKVRDQRERDMEEHRKSLDFLARGHAYEREEIEKKIKAMQEEAIHREKIRSLDMAIELAMLDQEELDPLARLQKEAQIREKYRQEESNARREAMQAEIAEREAMAQMEQERVRQLNEEISAIRQQSRAEEERLSKDTAEFQKQRADTIALLTQTVKDLKEEFDGLAEKYNRSSFKSDEEFAKALADPLTLEKAIQDVGRGDFSGDDLRVEAISRLGETLIMIDKSLDQLEDQQQRVERRAEISEQALSSQISSAYEAISEADEQAENLANQLQRISEVEAKEATLRNIREADQKAKILGDQVDRMTRDLTSGATSEQMASAKPNLDLIKQALADGKVVAEEIPSVTSSMQSLFLQLGKRNTEQLELQRQFMTTLRTQGQEIRNLKAEAIRFQSNGGL